MKTRSYLFLSLILRCTQEQAAGLVVVKMNQSACSQATDALLYSPKHSHHMATPQPITPLSEKKGHTLTRYKTYVNNTLFTRYIFKYATHFFVLFLLPFPLKLAFPDLSL